MEAVASEEVEEAKGLEDASEERKDTEEVVLVEEVSGLRLHEGDMLRLLLLLRPLLTECRRTRGG